MEPRKLTLATSYSIALLLFVLTVGSAFAFAQRPAGVHIDWTIVLNGPFYNGMTPIGNSDYEVQNAFRRSKLTATRSMFRTELFLALRSTESSLVPFPVWIGVVLRF